MARLSVVSYRLAAADGVSVEAAKWIEAFVELGHEVTTIAGEGVADVLVPSLAIDADGAVDEEALRAALDGADVVVVENLASLPLNPRAYDATYRALQGRRAILHHHDLPWQRERFRDAAVPRPDPAWRHVTINDLSRRQLAQRGVEATTIHNRFECDPPAGRRDLARATMEVGGERLVVLPTRALARKNVAGAIGLSERLDATLWLVGPAEDGYGTVLDALLERSSVRVRRGLPAGLHMHDVYAAADLVVLPSTWEGFGNPVIEAVTHRRPLAVYPYPVLEEIRSFGFRFFDLGDEAAIVGFLDNPDASLLAHNARLATAHFNRRDLPALLARELAAVGVGGVPIG